MGNPTGFMKIPRKTSGYRPVEERVNDYSEVEMRLEDDERRLQASRCMDCGIPFCHWACPVENIMPQWQDFLYKGDYRAAWERLTLTNPFPEFTGRVCPALCEASCVLGIHDEPVTIRQNELAVIEKAFDEGFVTPCPPKSRNGRKVAIVGGGPAGLSAAVYLNRAGFTVTVYEADDKPGGYLRYGIPDFKLDKRFIDRRLELMSAEGIIFKTNTVIGDHAALFGKKTVASVVSAETLEKEFDTIVLAIGARSARDLIIPGREANGIHQALDFLSLQNRAYEGKLHGTDSKDSLQAYGKKIVVIGGGDTGADCVGTANRQGARSIVQIEVMPQPPSHRPVNQPWPLWPTVLKTSSSHMEGCERMWSVNTKSFNLTDGKVSSLNCTQVEWVTSPQGGRPTLRDIPGSEFTVEADIVLLAMGFTHVVQEGIVKNFNLALDDRGNIRTSGTFQSSNPKVWATGDARRGASLVVHAIADGKAAAKAIIAKVG
ncbi:glutamate synthase subunit beta [Parasphaerochaeta coccoides]|uniref:Glutamate synthase (NADH) small subunit n=1 Tax=Parasphaerochaeta coccoides (strain ATCC BAA-1237 / DSM 17374 / SPN1) TaxID=760011 RepID=F4GK28_PARC1|nr:glutamate synthase subunit beta [Parasphaerochaeta coccoides]AEC01800.1 glutamate synthase (NADH) small subunit [Parasphaerochaeta coccoides DSM 17374]